MDTIDQKENKSFVSGDLKSFEMLFNQYYQPLVAYSCTMMKDKDEAEDIVQQVFVSVWEKSASLKIHTSPRAFLYKAVYNTCLNKIKQQGIRLRYVQEETHSIKSSSATDALQQKELREKINHSIETLPAECGKIFKMSRYDNLKYQEIADKLEISVKTVENQMGKALKLMRENLKEYLTILIIVLIRKYIG